ncbi:glycosyl transferase group 1 [Sulfolobus islandicus Y.N.15.51]|uniref:Glycosyl transferase group 1 n=1 Tax=Saccharolobus islandicus (strain Y.N.15.51 / Yellowstone \|nr:glycosyltransferase family 4 protein [Sulfolobus islandicus]ACP49283.1 glycosyl transferase group 1 [Sulfolobus islandicus Y.N.15.51]
MEKREKIVHVIHSFYPIIGGIEKSIYEIAIRQKEKYDITIITSSKVPKAELGLTVERLKSIRFFNMPDLTLPIQRSKILSDADIVHYHSQNSLFSVMLLNKNDNNVFTLMAINGLRNHPNKIIKLLSPLYLTITMNKVLYDSKKLIVKNLGDLKILREKYKRDAYLVPEGVNEIFFSTPRSNTFIEKIGDEYILYIGRLHKLKGIDVLIKASKLINSRIVFIGPGDISLYRKMAQTLGVDKKCIFLGYVDDLTKIQAIDSSSLVVIPSISDYVEAFSITLSEAWSREKAVVGSAVGSLKFRIINGVNGVLVPAGDHITLAEEINKLLDNKKLAEKMGKEGRKEVISWNDVVKLLDKVYWE